VRPPPFAAASVQILSVYFVDHVLDPPSDGGKRQYSRAQLAVLVGLAHALPVFLLKHLKELKAWFGVGGAARKSLQVDMMRKFLNFTEASRDRIGAAGFTEALIRDAVEVVDNGYMQLIALVASLGKIACILFFTSFRAPLALPLQLALPVFAFWRMTSREATATVLRLKYFRAQNRILDHANDVTKNYATVRDSNLKPAMANRLDKIVADVNYFLNAIAAHTSRSVLALPLLTACTVGAMMAGTPYVTMPEAVLAEADNAEAAAAAAAKQTFHMTAGTFLATLNATTQMGTEVEHFFDALNQIQLSLSALLRVFTFLNMQTETSEVRARAQAASARRPARPHPTQWPLPGDIDRSREPRPRSHLLPCVPCVPVCASLRAHR
jgi:ABC-type multidrug transport system fused ATPase/permease subunit